MGVTERGRYASSTLDERGRFVNSAPSTDLTEQGFLVIGLVVADIVASGTATLVLSGLRSKEAIRDKGTTVTVLSAIRSKEAHKHVGTRAFVLTGTKFKEAINDVGSRSVVLAPFR